MAGTLARLFKNKLAVALLGAALIAGAGTTAALAATGGLAQAGNSHASDSNDDHGHDNNNGNAQQTPNAASRQVEGTISSIDASASCFVVKTQGGTNVTVTANSKTIFDDDLHSFGDLKVGIIVEVKGNAQSNTSLIATKIERTDGANDDNDANDANDDNDVTDDHGGATNSGPSSTSGSSSGTSGSSGGPGRGGNEDGPAHQ